MLLLVASAAGCAAAPGGAPPALRAAGWAALPGWEQDRAAAALPALAAQCASGRRMPGPPTALVPAALLGDAAWWERICSDAASLPPADDDAARAFVAARFRPVRLDAPGLLTGYFEPVHAACLAAGRGCASPVLGRPPRLVDVEIRRIDPDAAPGRIRGCIEAGALAPCPTRAAIEAGALPDAPVLAWMDPVEKFFMQIQGSGRLALPGGGVLRLGYDSQNGAPYVPIGRVLLARGALERPVSMQAIRAWLERHPAEAGAVLDANPAYVFFRRLDLPQDAGPPGALGVNLLAGRSAAVDPAFVPLGLPLYLAPGPGADSEVLPPRLVLAQDTGGAIRGAGRVDLFIGTGRTAGEQAGRLAAPLRFWLLLPRLGAAGETR